MNVEFEGEQDIVNSNYRMMQEQKKPYMIKLLLKWGVKDERTANLILIGLAIFCFALSVYFFFF